ncbi:MAG: amino acid aminotransferase [Pseudomonadota bacterium]
MTSHIEGKHSVFQHFPLPEPDGILQLTQDFKADPRQGKIDLGVGVYRDAQGRTPIMASVQAAEARLAAERDSKAYLGLLGDVAFSTCVSRLVLGDLSDALDGDGRLARIQTPGGSGALRLGFELIKRARPDCTIWVPGPTWPNHVPVLTQSGLTHKTYPYYDAKTGSVDTAAMMAALAQIPAGDVILLHGCCHNPTGADLGPEHWADVAALLAERGIVPFVDMAYQGFGDGLEEDAHGVRAIFSKMPEALLSYSCSKNFGIYNERTGVLLVSSESGDTSLRTLGQMKALARVNHSMPPDHGAAIVATILQDEDLRANWLDELNGARNRVTGLRRSLSQAFREAGHGTRFDHLEKCRGMFSILGLSAEDVATLRREHAIFMPASSRVNVAGLQQEHIPALVQAVTRTLEDAS